MSRGMNVTKNKGKGMDRKQDFLRSTHYPVAIGKTAGTSTSTHTGMRIVQQREGS